MQSVSTCRHIIFLAVGVNVMVELFQDCSIWWQCVFLKWCMCVQSFKWRNRSSTNCSSIREVIYDNVRYLVASSEPNNYLLSPDGDTVCPISSANLHLNPAPIMCMVASFDMCYGLRFGVNIPEYSHLWDVSIGTVSLHMYIYICG